MCANYGRAACKPKHHHHTHTPLQASHLGVVCGCESMEAKHRVFNKCIADKFGQFAGGGIPAASLPRLLLSHVHELDQHDVFQLGLRKPTERSALRRHLPRGDRSVPLAAKEARLPHVSVACGDVLRTRDEACVARACCDNGSLLFIVQELRFDPRMQLAACVCFFFFLNHMCCCKLYARCTHACVARCTLQLARRGGHSAPT